MTTKRNGEIDALRFVFAIIITCYHFNLNYNLGIFVNGYIGVEFFFVVTGFLMAAHAARMNLQSRGWSLIADETWHYILDKTKKFYGYYLSAVLLQVVVRYLILRGEGLAAIGYRFLKSIPIFTLSFMGIYESSGTLQVGNSWYLSAMLIGIFLLYPLLLRNYKAATQLLFPILVLFILGYLLETYQTIANWSTISGFVRNGVLRAVAEMALGGSLYQLSALLTERNTGRIDWNGSGAKVLLTLLKLCCYGVVIAFAWGSLLGNSPKASISVHALLFCALGVFLSFSKAGYCIPDSRLTRYLGKLSLPIFIYHGLIRWAALDVLSPPISLKLYVALVVMSVVISVGLMYMMNVLAAMVRRRRKA